MTYLSFIEDMRKLCEPQDVYICDGSHEELEQIQKLLVSLGTFIPLNPKKRPGSYLARSDPDDVARVEQRTFVCSSKKEEAGPTNNWKDPIEMKQYLLKIFQGSMKGRRMYVIPFCMGPYGAKTAKVGIQITDSPYVVCNMILMTRVGKEFLDKSFIPCIHSVGKPLTQGELDVSWPCNKEKWIVHFPDSEEIWSYGSGYGGNALLGKKCLALRIASVMARREGWLAEHMLILGITNPHGEKRYIVAAFPSACGKTNLAMMKPTLPGWKVECVGDDIAWLHVGADGGLYAINPEHGFFGVAPGTSGNSNPNAIDTIAKNTIFTNVALTEDGDVWWEGLTKEPPPGQIIDWRGDVWSRKEPAAHPNSRFTVSITQCPILDPEYNNPQGVRIDAIIFGGRRAQDVPLVLEAESWLQGVFFGANLSSEKTAAAVGSVGDVRRDPFAMLPFCGYHMGDYFQHWLDIGKRISSSSLPKIYQINWFRKSAEGEFLWPGFCENARVLKWIFERAQGSVKAIETPIGRIPVLDEFDINGLSLSKESLAELFFIDAAPHKKNIQDARAYFLQFEPKFPALLKQEMDRIESKLYIELNSNL
jgi:phosphoenolpyruvate carboxykinase (GTP)